MNENKKRERKRGTGSIYRQPGCSTWTIKYYRNGKPVREATGLGDYQAARQKLNQRLTEIVNGTYAGPKLERVRVAELAEYFLRDYRINGRKSVDDVEARWNLHLKPFFADYRAMDVSSVLVARYVDQRLQEGAMPATVNRELAALKRMFRLGYYATPRMVLLLPAFPHLQENNVRKGFLEDWQYDELKNAIRELWMRAMVECARTYGWRVAELLNLRVSQLDFKARVIRLEPGTTKNQDGREVTMTAVVFALVSQCIQGKSPNDYVFTRSDGKPVRDFRDAWANVCCAVGLGRLGCSDCGAPVDAEYRCGSCDRKWNRTELKYRGLIFHDLRRTAARNLRRAGVAEGVIMRVGGWRTRSVFERYNIVSQADISDALQKLEQQQKRDRVAEFGHDFGHDREPADAQPGKARVN